MSEVIEVKNISEEHVEKRILQEIKRNKNVEYTPFGIVDYTKLNKRKITRKLDIEYTPFGIVNYKDLNLYTKKKVADKLSEVNAKKLPSAAAAAQQAVVKAANTQLAAVAAGGNSVNQASISHTKQTHKKH